jgi:hypothetical protein
MLVDGMTDGATEGETLEEGFSEDDGTKDVTPFSLGCCDVDGAILLLGFIEMLGVVLGMDEGAALVLGGIVFPLGSSERLNNVGEMLGLELSSLVGTIEGYIDG